MKKSTYLDKLEESSAAFTAVHAKAGIKTVGTYVWLYRKKAETIEKEDKVYGIYGGAELSHDSKYSIYNNATPPVDEVIEDESAVIDLSQITSGADTAPTAEVVIDERYVAEAESIRILLNAYQWRVIAGKDGGLLEDAGFAWALPEDKLKSGDVIVVQRPDDVQIRMKIIGPETIGNRTNLITRYKLSNIGD